MALPPVSADSDLMKDFFVTVGTWTALAVGFLVLAPTTPWPPLLVVTGMLWVALPVALASWDGRLVSIVSLTVFSVASSLFLLLAWVALSFSAGIGSLFFGLEADSHGAARSLVGAWIAGLAGASLGAMAGSLVNRSTRRA